MHRNARLAVLTWCLLLAVFMNQVDYAELQPGDLAVTKTGVHVLADLGNQEWIQADPGEGCVIRHTAPNGENRDVLRHEKGR